MAKFLVTSVNVENCLDDYMKQAPKTVMQVLHGEGAESIKDKIREMIPVSNRNKPHAKDRAKFTQNNRNLSVELIIGGKYGYLVFPDEGIGEHNPVERSFMRNGAIAAAPDICNLIESRVGSM